MSYSRTFQKYEKHLIIIMHEHPIQSCRKHVIKLHACTERFLLMSKAEVEDRIDTNKESLQLMAIFSASLFLSHCLLIRK